MADFVSFFFILVILMIPIIGGLICHIVFFESISTPARDRLLLYHLYTPLQYEKSAIARIPFYEEC